MDRNVTDLRPEMQARVTPWLEDCKAAGIDLLITCTLRTLEEQAILYAQGRTTPGKIVTKAKSGQSAHNYGFAIDVVVMMHGKPDWEGVSPQWQEAANYAKARELDWYGAPDAEFHELAHFQFPNWRTLI